MQFETTSHSLSTIDAIPDGIAQDLKLFCRVASHAQSILPLRSHPIDQNESVSRVRRRSPGRYLGMPYDHQIRTQTSHGT